MALDYATVDLSPTLTFAAAELHLSAQRRRGYRRDLPKRQNQQVTVTSMDSAWRQVQEVFQPPYLVRECRDPNAASSCRYVVDCVPAMKGLDPGALDRLTPPILRVAVRAVHSLVPRTRS